MPQKSVTVYVVDDDESIRRALKRLLRSAGYHAVTFESAEDFMEFRSRRWRGCLVLDIRLPGMTGLDLTREAILIGGEVRGHFHDCHENPEWRQGRKRRVRWPI